MWDTISVLATNPITIIALFGVLIILIIGVSTGKIRYKGHGLSIDSISSSSRIKQLQWDFLQAKTDIAIYSLPKEYLEEPKKWRTHYVLGKYRDVLQLAIISNNIIEDDEYIESKQILAYSAVLKVTSDEYFKSEEFKKYLNVLTKDIILQFVKIKNKYE